MLKIAIMLLMVALVASLASGFYFLMVDQGDRRKRRLFQSLGVRLGLAISLAALIVFGVATGQLGHRNPWDAGPAPAAANQPPPTAPQPAAPEPKASGDGEN